MYWLITYQSKSPLGRQLTSNSLHRGRLSDWVLAVGDLLEGFVFLNAQELDSVCYEALGDTIG